MIDEVSFSYYGGFIGDALQHSFITKEIKTIFHFRVKKIIELFRKPTTIIENQYRLMNMNENH